MIRKYKKRAKVELWIGMPIFYAGFIAMMYVNEVNIKEAFGRSALLVLGTIAATTIVGLVLTCIGLSSFSRAKLWPRWYGLLGPTHLLGLMLIGLLPDKSVKCVPLVCQECEYDLRGNVSGECPECGTHI
ncbi:hypothetical protein JD969_00980 [Planctomycetota bacterium]|nr:hypothetical protein JD969_00980 [Planctomycetota bacterium]